MVKCKTETEINENIHIELSDSKAFYREQNSSLKKLNSLRQKTPTEWVFGIL